jgi:hypothetical protein
MKTIVRRLRRLEDRLSPPLKRNSRGASEKGLWPVGAGSQGRRNAASGAAQLTMTSDKTSRV